MSRSINISESRYKANLVVVLNHCLLIFFGILVFNFQRDFITVFSTVFLALAVDLIMKRKLFEKKTFSSIDFTSPIISGLSLVILLNLKELHLYWIAITMTIGSKHLLSYNGKHYFNPSLIGILFAISFFEYGSARIQYDQFLGYGYAMCQILFLGTLALLLVNRFYIPLSYYLVLISLGFLVSSLGHFDLMQLIGPEVSASGLLFIFFMATDPKTSPVSKVSQVVFGIGLGLVSLLLAIIEIHHAGMIALFLGNYMLLLVDVVSIICHRYEISEKLKLKINRNTFDFFG